MKQFPLEVSRSHTASLVSLEEGPPPHLDPPSSLRSFPISHLPSAGYNNLEVAEYLLEHGADVNAQDKGGLIPLHNAASYGVSRKDWEFLISSLTSFSWDEGL